MMWSAHPRQPAGQGKQRDEVRLLSPTCFLRPPHLPPLPLRACISPLLYLLHPHSPQAVCHIAVAEGKVTQGQQLSLWAVDTGRPPWRGWGPQRPGCGVSTASWSSCCLPVLLPRSRALLLLGLPFLLSAEDGDGTSHVKHLLALRSGVHLTWCRFSWGSHPQCGRSVTWRRGLTCMWGVSPGLEG